MALKDIVRFKKNGRQQLIFEGVTQEQAQEWCSSSLTRKEGQYFDGFAETGTHCAKQHAKYTKYFPPNETYH